MLGMLVKVNLMLLDVGESELDVTGCWLKGTRCYWMLVKGNLMLLDVSERELDVTGCW